MNLCEWPLAVLAERIPKGVKTLTFEDHVKDKSTGHQQHRKLIVSGSDVYGLPRGLDDDVLLVAIALTKARNGFTDPKLFFTQHELVELLGWDRHGRSYARLRLALRRWAGVVIHSENAWRSKARECWVDASFGVLDNVWLDKSRLPRGGEPSCWLKWNEAVYENLQAGYLRQLDLDLYLGLSSSVAKRLFRHLSKRFYWGETVRVDLRIFAHEKIGLSKCYNTCQLRCLLDPAFEELEQVGLLAQAGPAGRYEKLQRGVLDIVLHKGKAAASPQSEQKGNQKVADPIGPAADLVARGVSQAVAEQIAAAFAPEAIAAKIALLDQLTAAKDKRVSKNPAGYLVASIRGDYLPPKDVTDKAARQQGREDAASRTRHARRRSVTKQPGSKLPGGICRSSGTACRRACSSASASRCWPRAQSFGMDQSLSCIRNVWRPWMPRNAPDQRQRDSQRRRGQAQKKDAPVTARSSSGGPFLCRRSRWCGTPARSRKRPAPGRIRKRGLSKDSAKVSPESLMQRSTKLRLASGDSVVGAAAGRRGKKNAPHAMRSPSGAPFVQKNGRLLDSQIRSTAVSYSSGKGRPELLSSVRPIIAIMFNRG